MSDEPIVITRQYLRDHEVISGKQRADCEAFGRQVMALARHRAMNRLGAGSAEEVTVDVKIKLRGIHTLDLPCVAMSIVADNELDEGLAETIVITHIEP